jgi:acetyl esterase/lipase
MFWVIAVAMGVVVLSLAAAAIFRNAATAPTPGPFYTPPDPLPAGEPGDILRSEPIDSPVPEGAEAWRILYLSTGLDGEPLPVSAVVVAPAEPSSEPRPVIAWAHGTVGVLPECGVSHTDDPYQQTPVLELMVNEGFIVVATDYPGLGTPGVHPYIVGPIAAHSVLDSVRAVRNMELNAGERFAVWGASQGGHASLWTAESAADYAPELTLVGAAASAPATDLKAILASKAESKSGGAFSSELLYAWGHTYPDANLDDIIKPEARAQFEKMAETCISTPLAFLTLGDILTPNEFLSADPATTEPWATLLAENTPHGAIHAPLLLTHGTADDLIPPELSDAEAARRCAAGEDVTLLHLPGVSHDARNESGVVSVGWIADRFAGLPTGSTCGE